MEEKGATLQEILPYIEGRRGQDSYVTGDVSNASISVGQSVGLIHDIPTVKEIIDGIINGAQAIIESLHNLGKGKQSD
jgi:nitronate monooxygenase